MDHAVSLIGYGEAGRTFACAAGWRARAKIYDLKNLDALYAEDQVTGCSELAEALAGFGAGTGVGTGAIISVVTADQALIAAKNAAQHIVPGTLFLDMNSVAPQTKQAAAEAIDLAGGHYVDVAIMSPVNPARMAAPLLISGPSSDKAAAVLAGLGFENTRIVGKEIGRASTIKMLRSVMYKGVEALTAECLQACDAAGVTDEVLGSFGNDWSSGADYRMDRMMVHGQRRSAEMTEVVKTLDGLGVDALMSRGTVQWQANIGEKAIHSPPEGLKAKLEILGQ